MTTSTLEQIRAEVVLGFENWPRGLLTPAAYERRSRIMERDIRPGNPALIGAEPRRIGFLP
jgi:hypothetical protein